MNLRFSKYSDERLAIMYRIAKTRLYPFFRDPKDMIQLRTEKEMRHALQDDDSGRRSGIRRHRP